MKKLKKTKIFIFGKKSHNAKKTERGDPLGFFNIHSVAKHQKQCRGALWGNFFRKKCLAVPEKMKGGTLLSRPVWYVTRKNRKNLFGSVQVQFGAIIFCRTFKNYFGQFVWIEKKESLLVAFHFMKRRLKTQCFIVPALNSRSFYKNTLQLR